jgi:hypothetical protein
MNVAENFLQGVAEARLLVVGRDYDAVFRRQKVLSSWLSVVSDYAGTENLAV